MQDCKYVTMNPPKHRQRTIGFPRNESKDTEGTCSFRFTHFPCHSFQQVCEDHQKSIHKCFLNQSSRCKMNVIQIIQPQTWILLHSFQDMFLPQPCIQLL